MPYLEVFRAVNSWYNCSSEGVNGTILKLFESMDLHVCKFKNLIEREALTGRLRKGKIEVTQAIGLDLVWPYSITVSCSNIPISPEN